MIKDKSIQSLFIGTASVNLFSKALTVILGVLFARLLGPEQYGLYSYVMSVLALLTLPVIAGLPNLIIREIAHFQLEEKWSYLSGLIRWSRWYLLIFSLITLAVTTTLIHLGFFTSPVSELLVVALLIIPFRGLLTQQGAILNGFSKPILAQIPSQILMPSITLVVISSLVYIGGDFESKILVKVVVLSSVLAFIVSAFFVNKVIRREAVIGKPAYLIKQWHLSLFPFTLMAVVSTLNIELASVFLGWLDTAQSVAFFKVALQGVTLISLGLSSINSVIMPKVARYYKQGDLTKTQELLTKSVRLSCVLSIPVIFSLIAFGDFMIDILFGSEYLHAYPLLIVLCLGQVVNVYMGSVGLVLNMTNNERYSLQTLVISLFITIILFVVLIPIYSALGAAVSVSIGLVVWNILMAVHVYKITNLKTWFQIKVKE